MVETTRQALRIVKPFEIFEHDLHKILFIKDPSSDEIRAEDANERASYHGYKVPTEEALHALIKKYFPKDNLPKILIPLGLKHECHWKKSEQDWEIVDPQPATFASPGILVLVKCLEC